MGLRVFGLFCTVVAYWKILKYNGELEKYRKSQQQTSDKK